VKVWGTNGLTLKSVTAIEKGISFPKTSLLNVLKKITIVSYLQEITRISISNKSTSERGKNLVTIAPSTNKRFDINFSTIRSTK